MVLEGTDELSENDELREYELSGSDCTHDVSMTAYMGRIANQRKIPKWLPFKNYKSES